MWGRAGAVMDSDGVSDAPWELVGPPAAMSEKRRTATRCGKGVFSCESLPNFAYGQPNPGAVRCLSMKQRHSAGAEPVSAL